MRSYLSSTLSSAASTAGRAVGWKSEGRDTPLTASIQEDPRSASQSPSRATSSSFTSNSNGDLMSRERPQIVYALVLKNRQLALVEHSKQTGNFQQDTLQILEKAEQTTEFSSYLYGEYVCHVTVDEASGLEFVCIAEPKLMRRLPFGFLSQLQEQFLARYPREHTDKALEYEMQTEFRSDMQNLMEKFNSAEGDRLTAMMEKVKDINDTLTDSIDKILVRQDKIELLARSSALLSQSADTFARNAQSVHRRVWWRNCKMTLCFLLVAIVGLGALAVSFCGWKLQCLHLHFGHHSDS